MPIERRYDEYGEIHEMAVVGEWVMVRRPRCVPFVVTLQDWQAGSRSPLTAEQIAEIKAVEAKRFEEAKAIARFVRGAG